MTKGKLPKTQIVRENIILRVPNRSSSDIETWRQGIKNFENKTSPSRYTLYDLYMNVLLDEQIEATWSKRKDSILNRSLTCVKDGKENEEINKLLNSANMRSLIGDLLDTVLWGYTLMQVNNIWFDNEEEQYRIDYDLIPRKHVHPEKDFECVSKEQSSLSKDFLFKEQPLSKYMIWAGGETDFGLLVKLCIPVILKRGDLSDWAQFAEMFAMPFRDATYDAYDDELRKKLEWAMENWAGANYMIHPKGTEINITPNNATGSNTVYKDLHGVCDASISKCVLGNTLTTEQGEKGSYELGKVHQSGENEKKRSDEKFILSVLNTQFRAILKRFGFDVSGQDIWFETPPTDWKELKIKWEVIDGIAERVPVDDDFIYEEFDIPKPANYDELKENLAAAKSYNPMQKLDNPLSEENDKKEIKNKVLGRVLNFFA